MTPPKAARAFAQVQPADDAGASEIEYVLDTKTYAKGPFLHDELEEYQGPALMTRNNSVFRDSDFESLSSVGDSGKKHDLDKIGKFGQGFNSVFHMTDGPWVFSRDTLLILDPHHRWSKAFEVGGPAWNISENRDCSELTNHLATFAEFNVDTGKELNETIIRLPLRTTAQAAKSKIKSEHGTTVEDVKTILEKFCEEIEFGQLLFLKNIRKVFVRIDKTVMLNAVVASDDLKDRTTRDALSEDFRNMYVSETYDGESLSRSFQTKIEYHNSRGSWTDTYLVQHLMAHSCGQPSLDAWARDRKLFPWVAIAAPILTQGSTFVGRLFSTLSLGTYRTTHPVHIHALFSIAPDRARLGFEDQAVEWNTKMLQKFCAPAWVELLEHRNTISCHSEMFALWPTVNIASPDLWLTVDDFVLRQIIANEVPVWNTSIRSCVKLGVGYMMTPDPENEEYAAALSKAHLPIVALKKPLFTKVQQIAQDLGRDFKVLAPATVRSFLRLQIAGIPSDPALLILEFCVLDAIDASSKQAVYDDLQGLRVFPTLSGELLPPSGLLLPRDFDEMELFSAARPSETVDLHRLSQITRELLSQDVLHFAALRHRSLQDLHKDWPTIYHVPKDTSNQEIYLKRPGKQDPILKKVWTWIHARYNGEGRKLPTILYSLWLIPLRNGRVRQLGPVSVDAPTLVIQKQKPLELLLIRISTQSPKAAPPALDDLLTSQAASLIRKELSTDTTLHLACQDQLHGLIRWLVAAKSLLVMISKDEKKILLAHLAELVGKHGEVLAKTLRTQVCQLPLFSTVISKTPYEYRKILTTSVPPGQKLFEIPAHLPPLPDIECISFVDLSNPSEKQVLQQSGVIEEISNEQLLTQHLLPWMRTASEQSFENVKRGLADWIFFHSKVHDQSWIQNVLSQPVIPLSVSNKDGSAAYGSIGEVIDPMSPYASMYFDWESFFPDAKFYQEHKYALGASDIGAGIYPETPLARARVYASCGAAISDLTAKVRCLFTVLLTKNMLSAIASTQELRDLRWIPGISIHGAPALFSPSECRGADQSYLVDKVWGQTSFTPDSAWESLLGWNQNIPKDVLLKQLDLCIEIQEKGNVDQILSYLERFHPSALQSRICLLGSQGSYHAPDSVFYPGSTLSRRSLLPFMDRVDPGFAKAHTNLLRKLDVKSEPSIRELRKVQDQLVSPGQETLTDASLAVAIAALEVATRQGHEPEHLSILLVPDTLSKLRAVPDIVHGDRNVSGKMAEFHFTHPAISEALVGLLAIENAFERATRLAIDFEDQDDDEYVPRETLQTVITDTLSRYSISATFNEYLANADDAQATRVSWTLDEREYGSDLVSPLLDKELDQYQGPSLLVHNDGVFSDRDFEGFKNIGQGGKTAFAETTGMFGRGALSMYHFCDVPCLISGGFFVILDPQEKCLPRNRHYKRKVGIKISLTTIRKHAPGHLTPFDGLHGYYKGLDNYEGTIFRFPLRKPGTFSSLVEHHHHVSTAKVVQLLKEYFDIARSSLLFLQNVESIDFSIRGKSEPEWSISALRSDAGESEVFSNVRLSAKLGEQIEIQDEWRVGVKDLESSPPEIIKTGKGFSKTSECGIAACIRSEEIKKEHQTNTPAQDKTEGLFTNQGQRVFCRLPTNTLSRLPVSFHASFTLTADRRTISFTGAETIDKWNRWLLTECISELYVRFLEQLATSIGVGSFRFWPPLMTLQSEDGLSSVVAEAFWRKVTSDTHQLDKLYPLASMELPLHLSPTPSTNLRRSKGGKTRKEHKSTILQNARFDFLEHDVSETLRPLFSLIGLAVVRPGKRVESGLRTFAPEGKLVVLNYHFLSGIFKDEANCLHLENFLAGFNSVEERSKAFVMLLHILVPIVDGMDIDALEILDGCRILPRPTLDGNLGLLKLSKKLEANVGWHLAANPLEEKLFSFASKHLVHTRLSIRYEKAHGLPFSPRCPIKEIMKGQFNIRKLELSDLGFLVALPQSPVYSSSTPEVRERWTDKFWLYLNAKVIGQVSLNSAAEILDKTKLWDQAIYRTKTTLGYSYLTPRSFGSGPYVVEPDDQTQRSLCALFPGLMCIDPDCLPEDLLSSEEDLKHPASFERFLSAISRTQVATRIGQHSSPLRGMSLELRDVLRELVVHFLEIHERNGTLPQKDLIRLLPIWPRVNRPETEGLSKSLTAENAIFCKHAKMFKPWVRDLQQFVEPDVVNALQTSLHKLGVPLLPVHDFWPYINKSLPNALLDAPAREEYLRLVAYMIQHLSSSDIPATPAPDGNGKFCKVNNLYDHEDKMFRAAFYREQPLRFVHPDLRKLHHYWLSQGLRTRPATKAMSREDYLQCSEALDQQFEPDVSSSGFEKSTAVVTEHLKYDRSEFAGWPNSTWTRLSQVRIHAVQDDVGNQAQYRRPRMSEIARAASHCALDDAGQFSDTRIVWSQLTLLKKPPAGAVFALRPQGDRPSVSIVFEHLKYLIALCKTVSHEDIPEFLEDVKACYEYLQASPNKTAGLPGIRDARVWFNVDSTRTEVIMKQDLLPNLLPANSICLNAPDDVGAVRVAKNFLIPYEKLLKALGCQAVFQREHGPSILSERVKKLSEASPMAESMKEILKFLDKGELTDVIFEAQGQQKSAHKVFLAAASEYCKAQFAGPWGKCLKTNTTIVLEDLNYETLSKLVDFAYTGVFTEPQISNANCNDGIADVLDDLLDLLEGADRWLMQRLHDFVEAFMTRPVNVKLFVRVENVSAVMKRAEDSNAGTLLNICETFKQDNLAFVESSEKDAAK